jgi:hypothetical protein
MFGSGEIREKMAVYDRGGEFVGTVQRVEGASIRLAEGGPAAPPEKPYLHLYWVDTVGRHVTLDLSREEVQGECYPRPLPPRNAHA